MCVYGVHIFHVSEQLNEITPVEKRTVYVRSAAILNLVRVMGLYMYVEDIFWPNFEKCKSIVLTREDG